jgi:murein DD-endopeptidase MepM/ murein hydrolase activator NlpD
MFSIGSYAQDAIARQAPSDKRMKDIRNVKLYNKIETIDLDNPASDIYTDWTEDFRRCSGSVPSNYQIDLRGFCMPTTSRKVTSNYGRRWRKQHEGIDVKVYTGDTIRAAFDGKVRICKYNRGGYGYYIVIRHPNGLETLYGHLSKQIVKKDQIVRAGEPIGLGGNTGKSSGSHLHFETRLLGKPINPALMFDFEHQDITGDYYVVRNGKVIKEQELAAATRSANHIKVEDEQKHNSSIAATSNKVPAAPTSTESDSQEQPIIVPQTKEKSISHSVKKGDTLSAIARKYGTTINKLCELNGIKTNTTLRPGQTLKCS